MDLNTRILVVDDFSTMRLIAKRILKSLGFTNIAEAEDGLKALDVLRSGRVDLVLSDCNMPNMNGIELLTSLRKDQDLSDIPVIVMTSSNQKDSLLEMVKAGANDYIEKPFKVEELKLKLEKFVG